MQEQGPKAGRKRKKDSDMNKFTGTIFGDTSPSGTVVSMGRFRSGKGLSPIRQAEAYWSALRVGTSAPRRSQIDPRGLANILKYAFIIERIAPCVGRFRLAGHHLNDLAGMEVRGMPLSCFFTAPARPEIAAVLEHMFDAPAVAELTLNGETGTGLSEARMILLPLENEVGKITRALGVLIADGAIGHTPHRFSLSATYLRPLAGPVQKYEMTPEPTPEPTPGFAETQSPVAGNAPHLRLVT